MDIGKIDGEAMAALEKVKPATLSRRLWGAWLAYIAFLGMALHGHEKDALAGVMLGGVVLFVVGWMNRDQEKTLQLFGKDQNTVYAVLAVITFLVVYFGPILK